MIQNNFYYHYRKLHTINYEMLAPTDKKGKENEENPQSGCEKDLTT